MNPTSLSFEPANIASALRLSHYIEVHRCRPQISLDEHIKRQRKKRAVDASALKLIYLDTNAWKCLSDFRLNKPNLTPEMKAFAESIERASQLGNFAFPIGLQTFLELDSMTEKATREMLIQLVDELSRGLCLSPFLERAGLEMLKLQGDKLNEPEGLEDFLCSPIELIGIPRIKLQSPDPSVGIETFNKALYDTLSELPFSFQYEIAGKYPRAKWDNLRDIAELNDSKSASQSIIVNLNTGIFFELKGCIKAWCRDESITLSIHEIDLYALQALSHWHENPSSRALPTLRVLSALYGLMRFDSQRRYKKGDPSDFMVAATALPITDAFFTDRKLANLISDKRIGLERFSHCTVVSGFDRMAEHLEKNMP